MEGRKEKKGRGVAGTIYRVQMNQSRRVLGWEDGLVSKVLALGTQGPEFDP